MRADSYWAWWVGLLLALALLTTGCASLTPLPGQEMNLSYTSREAAEPALAEGPSVDPPHALASPPPSLPESEAPERPHRRRGSREAVTEAGAVGGTIPRNAAEPGWQSATLARQAVIGAIGDVSGSTNRLAASLSKLKTSKAGIGGRAGGVFTPYVVYGVHQLQWVDAALGGATTLANAASEVDDPDMELAILRLTGPRLQAAMFGSLLLAAWLDFLNLADVVLKQCPFCGKEHCSRTCTACRRDSSQP